MQNALLSGLTGLRVNQQYLDVIGNNLSNANTFGYKSSRVTFVDVLGQTWRPAQNPTGATGGVNALQIGRGVGLGSIDRNNVQGSLLNTGRNLDMGVAGNGFFVVSDGNQNFFTRVGTFGLDGGEHLVDLKTGYRVQSADGEDIRIRMDSTIPPEATGNIDVRGNLPAEFTGPLAEVLQSNKAYEDHQPATLVANAGPYNLSGGETLLFRVDNGATQTVTLPPPAVPGAMTAAEIATYLNGVPLSGATAVDNAGTLQIVTGETGANASIFVDATSTAASAIFPGSLIGQTVIGTESIAVGTTNLNDLQANNVDYIPGDQIRITGTRPDGSPVSGIFTYGTGPGQDGVDLAALVTKVNAMYNAATGGATAMLNADGTISLTADQTGEALLTMTIANVLGSTGNSNWSNHLMRPTVQGTDPDIETIVNTIYDSAGQAHALTVELIRQDDGSWNLEASVDSQEGSILSPPITGILFDGDGLLNQIPAAQIEIQWNSLPGVQEVNFDLGLVGETEGLTQFGLPGSVFGVADGFTAGNLTSVAVRADGTLDGFYTNGKVLAIDRLGLAIFSNPAGLESIGQAMLKTSANSGEPIFTGAQQGSAGAIVAGSLEASNVDIAEEFVHMIEAQRSFQASARIISTTDEVLSELVRLV